MLRSVKKLEGFSVGATDGEIGKVSEFYFDDLTWTIRYMVVKTGGWLTERKVLISPEALLGPDWDEQVLPVNLTKDQVKNSPDINTDKPVSKQEEESLFAYYPWQNYYDAGFFGGTGIINTMPPFPITGKNVSNQDDIEKKHDDSHLRSTDDVKGYTIHAVDGAIGDVSDFLIDEASWKIRFVVVDTGDWLPGKKVLLSPQWIKGVDWAMEEVTVNVNKKAVQDSPEYDTSKLPDSAYHDQIHEHYGHPKL